MIVSIVILILIITGCINNENNSTKIEEESKETIPNWYNNNPQVFIGTVPADDNLFHIEIKGIISKYSVENGYYEVFSENGNLIFEQIKYGDSYYNPDFAFTSEQYTNLSEKYGILKLLTFEEFDSDGDEILDIVAIKYEGTEGVLEFKMDTLKNGRGNNLDVGPSAYFSKYFI